jgi:hypothetical protein
MQALTPIPNTPLPLQMHRDPGKMIASAELAQPKETQ